MGGHDYRCHTCGRTFEWLLEGLGLRRYCVEHKGAGVPIPVEDQASPSDAVSWRVCRRRRND